MPAFANYLLPSVLVLMSGCSFYDSVEAPPINEQIVLEEGEPQGPLEVQCDGPDDELQLLGSLCGSDASYLSWKSTDASGSGMATSAGKDGAAQLFIFNEIDRIPDTIENVASEVAYAAYVVLETTSNPESSVDRLNQWTRGEAVDGGNITTQSVTYDVCGASTWIASGTFIWRNTEISLRWDAGAGC